MTTTTIKTGPTARDYQDALHAQSACNLSGIVGAFARVTDRLWEEARALGKGTEHVNRHPIARLYAEHIAYLSGAGTTSDAASYSAAYAVCVREAAGE